MRSAVPVMPVTQGFGAARSFGIVSTFPPTSCGIATFSAALARGLVAGGASVDVVRCGARHPGDGRSGDGGLVTAAITDWSRAGRADATRTLNASDVVIVQHEYGLYPGADGDSILALMSDIDVPLMVVAHTVLTEPTPHQRDVLERVCALADAVVVMTKTARDRLFAGFDVVHSKVHLIPHGAATPQAAGPRQHRQPALTPRLLTWGLLGPGKGIEWAIDALDSVSDLHPRPEYVVAGATHPKVREQHGEAYREMLIDRAARSGSADHVVFDDTYRDLPALIELIETADVVVLPYDSQDQVTSGVLVDAVALGRPVVSTAFPHAVELLASGAGIVVPQRDPEALGQAIRSVLTDHALAASMAAEASRLAPSLSWSAVAGRYARLGDRLATARQAVAS